MTIVAFIASVESVILLFILYRPCLTASGDTDLHWKYMT